MHLSFCLVVCFVVAVYCDFQPFYEGFETTQSFQLPSGQSSYTISRVSPGAQSTQQALRLTGSQTTSYDGPFATFSAAPFYSVSFWVKTAVKGDVGGVAFSSGSAENVLMQFQFFSSGQFGVSSNTGILGHTNYDVNTWYYIIFDINWAAKTYDFYVNQQLVATYAELINYTAESISTVTFFNIDPSGDSYYDEIYVGCPGGCNSYSCSATYATCECDVSQACYSDCSQNVKPLSLFVQQTGLLQANQSQFYSYNNPSTDVRFALKIRVYNGSVAAQMYGDKVTGPAFCASSDRYTQTYQISSSYIFEFNSCVEDTFASLWSIRVFSDSGAQYSLEIIDGPQELYNNIAKEGILSSVESKFVFHVPENVNGMAQLVITLQNTSEALSSLAFYTLVSNSSCASAATNQLTSTTINGHLQLVFSVVGGERYTFDAFSTDFPSFYYNLVATLSNCDNACNNNGVCLNGNCVCNQNLQQTPTCDTYACMNSCNLGTCSNGTCSCPEGYSGADCGCSGMPIPPKTKIPLSSTTYSLDLSSFPSGAQLVTNLTGSNVQVNLQGCTVVPSYAFTATQPGVFSVPVSPCILQEIGSSAVILQISGSTDDSTLLVEEGNYGVGTALLGSKGLYFASQVQAISNFPNYHILTLENNQPVTLNINVIGHQASAGSFVLYLSNLRCPSSSNYLHAASSSTANTTLQVAYTPTSPSDTLYFGVVNSMDFISSYDLNITVSDCSVDCSGQGVCYSGACQCYKFFTGEHCEIGLCASDCNGNGVCVEDAICSCNSSFSGQECACHVNGTLAAGIATKGKVSPTDRYHSYSLDPSLSSFGFTVSFLSNSSLAFAQLLASNIDCYTEGSTYNFMDTGSASRQYACGLSYPAGGNWIMTVDGNGGNSNYSLTVSPSQPTMLQNAFRVFGVQATPIPQYFQFNIPKMGANSTLQVVVSPSVATSLLTLYVSDSSCPSARNHIASATQDASTSDVVVTLTNFRNASIYIAVTSPLISTPYPTYSVRVDYDTSDCSASCGNGVCANGACACYYGYSGKNCDSQICNNDCSGHGSCTADNTCQCLPGFLGASNCKCSLLGNITKAAPATILVKNAENYIFGLDLSGLNHTNGWQLTSSSPMSFYGKSLDDVNANSCPDPGNFVSLVNTTHSVLLRPCTPEFNTYNATTNWVVNLYAKLTSQISLSVSEVAAPQIQSLQIGQMIVGAANALSPAIYKVQIPPAIFEKEGVQISFSSSAVVPYSSIRISDSPCPDSYAFAFYNPSNTFYPVLLSSNTTYYFMVEINSITDTKFNFSIIMRNVSCTKSCNNSGFCVNDECACFTGYSGKDCEVGCGMTGCGAGNCTGKDTCTCPTNSYGSSCNCSISASLSSTPTQTPIKGNVQYYVLDTSAFSYGWLVSFSYSSANNYDVSGYPLTDISTLSNCAPSTTITDFNKYKINDGLVGYELLPCTEYYSKSKFLLATQFSSFSGTRNITASVTSSAKIFSASNTGSILNITVPAKSTSNIGRVMYIVTIGRPYPFSLTILSSQLCNIQVSVSPDLCSDSSNSSMVFNSGACKRSEQNYTLSVPNFIQNSVFYLWASTNASTSTNVTFNFAFNEPTPGPTGQMNCAGSVSTFFYFLVVSLLCSFL